MVLKPLYTGFLLAAAFLFTNTAFAIDNNKGFFGVNVGTAEDIEFAEEDTGYKLTIGKKVSDNISYELSYVYLGEYFGLFTEDGVAANVVFSLPVSDTFSVFGKAGLLAWTIEAFGAEETGTDMSYGVGIETEITYDVSFVLEAEFFEVFEGDVDLVTAGLKFAF